MVDKKEELEFTTIADKMFYRLGYTQKEKSTYHQMDYIQFSKVTEECVFRIRFNLKQRQVKIAKKFKDNDEVFSFILADEIKAINEKIKELNW